MHEFNTYEDLTAIMAYKRHEMDKDGDYGTLVINIDEICSIHEAYCKSMAIDFLVDCLNKEV